MVNRMISVLSLFIILGATACGTIATPEWTAVPAAEATAEPTAIPATPTPAAPIDPAGAQIGRWMWQSFTTSAETYPPVQLWFDVSDGGAVSGVLSVYPNAPDIPPAALTLIQQNGCNVEIESLSDAPIDGMFVNATEARVQVDISACAVKFYGDVTLAEPLRGEFVIQYDETLTLALLNPVDTPLTPLERGRKVFSQYCSACHGTYGEGSPGIPSLNTDEVRARTDEELLQIINNGVINTVMPAWGNVLVPEDIEGVLELVRNIDVLLPGGQ